MLPAIENGFTFIAFLMFLAGGLLAMEKYTKWKVFNWVPPLVWIYILNMVFCTLGLYNSEGVSAAYDVLKNNLLYAMIFVMLLRCDFRKIAKLSGRMIAIFLGCSITLALGFIVGFPIFKGSLGGGETIWGATAALYASWVGGSANMAAMQDALPVDSGAYSCALALDTVCYSVWIALLLLAVRYARKGFLASVVQLTGSLISLFGARAFSGWAAGQVFERFLAGSFRDQIAANIAAGGAVSLDGIAQRYAGFLPEAFRASIVDACERSISAVLNDNAVVLADTIVQKVLAPLLTPVISLVLFFVAFALLRMLVSLLVTVLGLVNKLPVIGAVNHWLGWGVGGIASLVDIYLVLCVVWALIVITGGNLTMLNDTVMSGSLYYKVFNVFNPFV